MTDIHEPQESAEDASVVEAPLRTFVKDNLEISTNVPIEINNLLCGGWQEVNTPSIEETVDKPDKPAPAGSAVSPSPEQARPIPAPAAKTGKDK